MKEGPVSLSRSLSRDAGLEDMLDEDERQTWPLWVKLLLITLPLVVAGVLVLRWLDDTQPQAQVQLLDPLPPVDATRASTSAMTYPFARASEAEGSDTRQGPRDAARNAAVAPRTAPARTPPGITPERWQALVEELSAKPNGAAEIARLEAYFQFSDSVRQFRELQRVSATDEPSAAMVSLAKRIDSAIDIHLQRRELSGNEAYDIKAAVLEVIEPDSDALDEKLDRWAEGLPRQTTDSDRTAIQRDEEFARRQTALVATWSALAPQQRDPKALERDINNLRLEIYGARSR